MSLCASWLTSMGEVLSRLWIEGRRRWRHVPWADASRSGIACALPAIVAVVAHQPLFCWSAIAAFWACLADSPSAAIPQRVSGMAAVAVLGAVACAGAIALHPMPVAEVLVTLLLTYVAALLRGIDSTLGVRALLVATAFAVSATFSASGWADGLQFGRFYLIGGLWALACNVGLWQSRGHALARRARFAYAHALAAQVKSLADSARDLRARGHRTHVRQQRCLDGLRAAEAQLSAQADPGVLGWPEVGERAMGLLAALENLMLAPTATRGAKACKRLAAPLRRLAELLEQWADDVGDVRAGWFSSNSETLARRRRELQRSVALSQRSKLKPAEHDWLKICLLLVQELAVLTREAGAAVPVIPEWPCSEAPHERVVLSPIRAFNDAVCQIRTQGRWARYAARFSITSGIVVALAASLHLRQGYWAVITALWVVHPSFAQTVKTSGLRLGGTALGAVIASLLDWLLPTRLMLGLSILPLATATFAGRAFNYLSYVLFLTPQFVLVAQLGASAMPPWALALSRLENSVAGAVVGLLVSLLVWPEWERSRLAQCKQAAMLATRAYVMAALARVAGASGRSRDAEVRLRRQAYMALDALDAAVQSVRFESFGGGHQLALLTRIARRLRELVGVGSLLEYGEASLKGDERHHLTDLARWACGAWGSADPSGPLPAMPAKSSPEARATVFLVRHLGAELVAGALELRALALQPFEALVTKT